MVPSGDGRGRDRSCATSPSSDAEARAARLAAEQAALRRVATLVAGDAPPEQVFQTVTEEVCRLLGLRTAVLRALRGATSGTIVGKFGDADRRASSSATSIELEAGWRR